MGGVRFGGGGFDGGPSVRRRPAYTKPHSETYPSRRGARRLELTGLTWTIMSFA